MSSTPPDVVAFRKEGARLASMLQVYGGNEQELPRLQQWLDDAPFLAQHQDMRRWGKCLASMLNSDLPIDATSIEKDANRLYAYLRAMTELPLEHWGFGVKNRDIAPSDAPPANEGFDDVVRALGREQRYGSGQHVFSALMASNTWQPERLLGVLGTFEGVYVGEELELDFQLSLLNRSSPKNLLLCALWPLLHETDWRPSDSSVYGDMWKVCTIGGSRKDSECAAKLARCVPSQNGGMLQALLYATSMEPEAIALFFPLNVEVCDGYIVLNSLVGLLTEGGRDELTYKARLVDEHLNRHNPELASLLQMHLTLFPEACEACSHAEMLVPAFNALYQRPMAPVDSIDSSVFSSMDASI